MIFQRIHIELTNNCNFACQFCPQSLMKRERGNMESKLLLKILDEISREELTRRVAFHLMGEPTLYPELNKAVEYAKKKGLEVYLTTNGSVLTEDLLGKLLSSDIDHIIFSVQTPDEKSFSLRQSNMSFDEYRKLVTALIGKILVEGKRTRVTLSFLTTPFKWFILPSGRFNTISNKRKLIWSIDQWIDMIVSNLTPQKTADAIMSGKNDLRRRVQKSKLLGWNKFRVSDRFFIDARPVGDWIHPGLFSQRMHKARIGYCEGMREHLGILWNGDMVFCCVDFDGNTSFANADKTTIKDALNNSNIRALIDDFEKMRISHPYCQRCLGDVRWTRSMARQVGSIFYFKWYRRNWQRKREGLESLYV